MPFFSSALGHALHDSVDTDMLLKLFFSTLLIGGLSAPAICQNQAQHRLVTLEELNALVMVNNPDIHVAAAASRGSDALVQSANTSPNPTLGFGASSISNVEGIGPGPLKDKRIDQSVRIDRTFERGNKRGLRTNAAREGARASRLDYSDAVRTVRMQLVSAYYDLLSAQERAAAAAQARQSSASLVRLAETRQKAGDLSAADLNRINIDLSRASNDAESARLDVLRAHQVLATLINDRSALEFRAAEVWPETVAATQDDIEELLGKRPDVQAAQHRVDQARLNLSLAESQRTRDVSLGAQVDRNPAQTSGVTFGLFLSVPLFFGNDYSGDIEKARADLVSADSQLEKVRAASRADWRRMQAETRSLEGRWLRYKDDILPNIARSTQSAELAFRNGAISIADLLDAQRTARALQAEAVQAHADLAKSQLNLQIMRQSSQ